RPNRAMSAVGMLMGIVFFFVGLTVIIPKFGAFGVIWTLAALGMAVFQGYNAYSRRGVAAYEVEIESDEGGEKVDFDAKLRRLAKRKEDGLISEEEFARKRAEILDKKW